MTLLKIAHIGHPVLRERARALSPEELASPAIQTFIDDLVETMRDANGAGLAANQVYAPVRLCVIEMRGNNPRYPARPAYPLTVLANPVVEPLSDARFDNYEGCLSIPELRARVPRAAEIRVRGQNRDGSAFDCQLRGITAGTFQHEIDHLDGVLFLDRVADPRSITTMANFSRFEEERCAAHMREVIAAYGS